MMEHVAVAVQHIHDAKILHRDLKPSNIMIESSGHSWVIDIGLGRELDRSEDALPGTVLDPTRLADGMTGGIGTLAYMAPEQLGPLSGITDPARPAHHDARTDVWGLGATLYELLSLCLPFPGQSVKEVARKILSEPPGRLSGSIPRELKAICLKALEKDPGKRYESAAAFAADLRRWLEVRPTLAGESAVRRKAGRLLGWPWVWLRRLGFWSQRRRAAAFAAGLLTALLVGGIVGAKAQLDAARRELEILALPRLRSPIRQMGWFPKSWQHVRSLRGGSTSPDPQLQGQAAAALERIDARVVKTLPVAARAVEFDPRSDRLLIFRTSEVLKGKPWFRTTLWDRTTYQTVLERDLGPGVLAFRPDGTPLQLSWVHEEPPKSRLSTKLRLFNVTTGEILREYRSPLGGLTDLQAIALSRQGSRFAAVSVAVHREGDNFIPDGDDRTIAAWDAASDKPIHTLKHQATQDLILSPDGRLLAAWDVAGEITVWTLPDGKELSRFRVGRAPLFCLAFGRDPVWHEDSSVPPWLLAVGESSGLITVWDLRAGRPRSVCRGSIYEVRALDFSADGALLVSAGRNPAKLWDVATGTCLLDLGMGNILNNATFAPDGRHLSVNRESGFGAEPGVDLMELELGRGTRTLYGLQGNVEKTIFSPDGRLVAAVTHEWQVGIFDWPSGRLRGVLPGPVGRFADSFGMALDTEGRRFACSVGHQARLWDLETGRRIGQWTLPEGMGSLAFHGRDLLLLVRVETQSRLGVPYGPFDPRDPRVVRVYDLLSPNPTKAYKEITEFGWNMGDIVVTPDGSRFVVDGIGLDGGKLVRRFHVYDGPTGKLLQSLPIELPPDNSMSYARFDPSGRFLAAMLGQASLRFSLFELTAVTYRGSIDWPVDCLNPGATRWLAVLEATDNQPLQHVLYDREHREPLLRIVRDVRSAGSRCHCFSPDGRSVMTGNGDGTISICDLVEVNRRLSELHLGW